LIRIGPAGASGLGNLQGLQHCKELQLHAMEVEFTYGVRMKNEEAKKIGLLAKELNIDLSVHAPYYINLASLEKQKIHASKERILQSCEKAHYLNAKYVVFHPGFYQKRDPEEIFQIIKEEIIDLQKTIKEKKWKVELAPETTGKPTQFGNLDELLRLKKETGCHICIDFAHLKARNNGKVDYEEVFKKIKHLKHIHAHFSGIEFTPKGERRHIITESKDIKELLGYIKKYKIDITIINESPDPYGDCIKTLKLLK
jgi:deoxyribonuclease-4